MRVRQICYLIVTLFQFCLSQAWGASREESLFSAAIYATQNNDLEGCLNGFARLLRMNSRKALYWFNLGSCQALAGQHDKASASFGWVVKLKSPLAPAAQLYGARSLLKLGHQAQARKILLELQAQNLPPSLRAELALTLYEQEMYAAAEKQIRQIPKAPDSKTQLLLGMALMKQNKNSEAEKVLKTVFADPDLTAEDRSSVKELLKSLKTEAVAREKSFWLFLDIAYGSTSNAYLEGRSLTPVSSPLWRGSLGMNYKFFQSPSWTDKVSYIYDYEDPVNAPELKTQTHSLQWPFVYRSRQMEVGFVPYLQAQWWNGAQAWQKGGALVRSALSRGTYSFGFDIEVFSEKGVGDTYAYLTGTSYSVRPNYGFNSGNWSGQLYWLFGSDGTQDIVYADGSRLPLQHLYQGPGFRAFWKATSSSSFLLQLLYLERNYKNNSLPQDQPRQDREWTTSLKYVYGFARNWVFYALAEYNPNKSTLGSDDVRDKNYDNKNILAGVGWDAF